MKNEIEQIAQQNDMSIEFVTWFFNEKKVGCGNVWFMMMAAMWEGWKGRSIEMDKLAAENVALKDCVANHAPAVDHWNAWADPEDKIKHAPETPATDRIVAGIKADGVEEFAAMTEKVGDEEEFYDHGESSETLKYTAKQARLFAQQLRDGADK
ncbi:TPA: hypothetical protein ACS61O_005077 [Klebsiella pneumoniae]|uniref:hypothetical protein n=1 Tax=Klebsiella pneumoniae TaxID=573 RepID=UPI003A4CDA9E|nr:hypothetical protein [Klebsiella pneumoniae]